VGTSTETGSRGEQETTTDAQQAEQFSIRALAWADGETIPTEYTCNGENASPALEIESPPEVTQSFALVMDDPDAPNPPFVHWLLWDVPADVREIPRGIPPARPSRRWTEGSTERTGLATYDTSGRARPRTTHSTPTFSTCTRWLNHWVSTPARRPTRCLRP
jgi:Raf kinase inhibitor-like YbhB/YbcL family protein